MAASVAAPARTSTHTGSPRPLTLTRRQILMGGAMAAVAWAAHGSSALADVAIRSRPGGEAGNVLVTIFLRGGADGLSLVVPHGEDAYYRSRPTLAIARPGDRRQKQCAIDLDGFFGLHPSLRALQRHYQSGELAIVHACGSNDHTRSHFEAMATMEGGAADERTGTTSGWLARHLGSTGNGGSSPLRAVALSSTMPDSLRGATGATALNSLADFRLKLPRDAGGVETTARTRAFESALKSLYRERRDEIGAAGRETLDVLKSLNLLAPEHYKPGSGATYPGTELGRGLREVACLIKAGLGLEVACLDRGGWDTHIAQGAGNGYMSGLIEDVGNSLDAFHRDLGSEMKHVTVLVLTEFGRRLHENGGLGTDHGRAGAMLLLGGGVLGGRVHARWPGLEDHQLEGPGDLRVTTDYRDILAEVVGRCLGNDQVATVFPGFRPQRFGVTV